MMTSRLAAWFLLTGLGLLGWVSQHDSEWTRGVNAPAELTAKFRAKRTVRYPTIETPTLPAPFDSVSRARQDDPTYAAMLENLDTNLGRIFAALEELRLRDNTIVVFSSDNGPPSNHSKS